MNPAASHVMRLRGELRLAEDALLKSSGWTKVKQAFTGERWAHPDHFYGVGLCRTHAVSIALETNETGRQAPEE